MQPFQFRPDATYMIPGGLGGLGRSIASWMVDYGAKNILFTSRSGTADPKAKALVEELIKRGTRAKVAVCDISEASALQNVLDEATQEGFPEIRGVVTCAMQLQVSSPESLQESLLTQI
jgi:NAD(P)-dependent dehydrogenase (short-subunit alcohol dehydrogenase family)